MRKNLLGTGLLLALLLTVLSGRTQSVLDAYVSEGLSSNRVLQEKRGNLEKSLLVLQEAKSLLLPTTWLEGQYTLAKGGRSIDIPVGDLLNPVYKTLNQLTASNAFPPVSNQSEQFLPNNFYDIRLRTTLPVINPDLRINRTIQGEQTALRQQEVSVYARELVREIKSAYYNYLAASRAISIYQNALEVVSQNLRANQALLASGKGLPAYVSRAESEVQAVSGQLLAAQNEQRNARAYFNFLLNKPLNDPVAEQDAVIDPAALVALSGGDSLAIRGREELQSLETARRIQEQVLRQRELFRVPRVNSFLDLAAQDYVPTVKGKSFFYLAGVQVQVPLFSGKRNLNGIREAHVDLKNLELAAADTYQQLQLAAQVSRNNAWTAYAAYQASQKEQEAARQYFKLIDRGYREGTSSFLEWLDARNQYTNSQLRTNINGFQFLVALADLERQTAAYSINP
ncbi:MAG TPA: TolC family protein [Chitinophagaceae bacterium]|nr:TolC family protein [Chitinophagaceae bacterium]